MSEGCKAIGDGHLAHAPLRLDLIDDAADVNGDVPGSALCAPVDGEDDEAEVEGDEFSCEPCGVEPLTIAPSFQKLSDADVEEHQVAAPKALHAIAQAMVDTQCSLSRGFIITWVGLLIVSRKTS